LGPLLIERKQPLPIVLHADRLNPPQATRLQPVVRRVSPEGLQPVPLSRLAGVVKRMMIFVNDP
ncbi:MAG: hypothetical protein ACXWOV_05725, partial [Isosphaeraceae bacterium]